MDGLDTIFRLILHTIIHQSKLAELFDHVKRKLIEYLKEYEFSMTEHYQYCDLPLLNYSYTNDMIFYKFQSL